MRAALLLFFAALTIVPRDAWPQGNPLGPEFRVNTYTTDFQGQPSVAADPSGNFVVVWERDYDVGFNDRLIVGQRYDSSGAPLGGEFPVSSAGPFLGSDNGAAVATDGAGNFVVVWHETPLDDANVLGRRFASSGAPLGGQFEVGTSLYNFNPAVASDSAGNFVVVWEGSVPGDGSGTAIFGRRYAGSTPLGATFRVNTWTTNNQTYSSVAADPSGNFVVVWQSMGQDGFGLGVFGQRFDSSGAPLGPEFRVSTYSTGSQHRPSVSVDSSGNFVVVWQSMVQDGDSEGVFGQRYVSSGTPVGPEFLVNTFTTSYQARPSAAADASGNFVVAWHGLGSGYEDGVFGQRYDASGTPLGSEFRVNTYTPNSQVQPSVAADPSGDFVVVWQSAAQDGSGYGVFGQRYRPILPVELMNFRVE